MADPLITKKITDVQMFTNNAGTILQIQSNQLGQTPIDTMKDEIKTDVVAELLSEGGVSLGIVNIKGVVPTIADLDLITDAEINDGYQVEADSLVYVWLGESWSNGLNLLPEPTGVVEEGNTNAVSGGEVFNKLKDFTVVSKNIANPKNFTRGEYVRRSSDNKVFNSESVNWISLFIDKGFTVGDKMYLQGIGNSNIAGLTTIIFADESDNVISSVIGDANYSPISTIPSLTNKIYININNGINAGLDPLNSPYINTVMYAKGESISNFEKYNAFSVDVNKIDGIDPKISNNKTVKDNSEAINFLTSDYGIGYRYNGTSRTNLSTTFELSNIGDYFEINLKLENYTTLFDGLGVLGFGSVVSYNVFGFNTGSKIWFRETVTSSPYLVWDLPKNANSDYFTYKIIINANNKWELFINGISQGERDKTSNFKIDRIASAYDAVNFAKFNLTSLKININNVLTNFENLDTDPNSLNVEKNYIKSNDVEFSDTYYKFTKATNTFMIYTRLPKSKNEYAGFKLAKEFNMSNNIYVDYWRTMNSESYIFDGINMNANGISFLIPAENELAYKIPGTDDYSGGYHGDELLTSVLFFANEAPISIDNDIPLTSVKSFYYKILSTIHQAPIGSVPDPNHTLESNHEKITKYVDGGFDTYNKLTWQRVMEINIWYPALLCIHKDVSQYVYNEKGMVSKMIGDGVIKMQDIGARKYMSENITKGYKCEASSITLTPSDQDMLCEFSVSDRVSDSKYYRKYPINKTVAINEVWEAKTYVRFDLI